MEGGCAAAPSCRHAVHHLHPFGNCFTAHTTISFSVHAVLCCVVPCPGDRRGADGPAEAVLPRDLRAQHRLPHARRQEEQRAQPHERCHGAAQGTSLCACVCLMCVHVCVCVWCVVCGVCVMCACVCMCLMCACVCVCVWCLCDVCMCVYMCGVCVSDVCMSVVCGVCVNV